MDLPLPCAITQVQSWVEDVLEVVLEISEACVSAAAELGLGEPQRDKVGAVQSHGKWLHASWGLDGVWLQPPSSDWADLNVTRWVQR